MNINSSTASRPWEPGSRHLFEFSVILSAKVTRKCRLRLLNLTLKMMVVSSVATGTTFAVISTGASASGVTAVSTSLAVITKVGSQGDDYPAYLRNAWMDSLVDPWREYNRECTSFVAWALHSRNGFEMPFHDNAIGWGYDARQRGYAVNSTPAVGAVAWFSQSRLGHVAWVVAVGNDTVTVDEYNYNIGGAFDERTVAPSSFTGFIHFSDIRRKGIVRRPLPPTPPIFIPTSPEPFAFS